MPKPPPKRSPPAKDFEPRAVQTPRDGERTFAQSVVGQGPCRHGAAKHFEPRAVLTPRDGERTFAQSVVGQVPCRHGAAKDFEPRAVLTPRDGDFSIPEETPLPSMQQSTTGMHATWLHTGLISRARGPVQCSVGSGDIAFEDTSESDWCKLPLPQEDPRPSPPPNSAAHIGRVLSRGERNQVLVHVYDLREFSQMNSLVLAGGNVGGAFHAGVEVYGREWSYGAHRGVDWDLPRSQEHYDFRETIRLAKTGFCETDFCLIIREFIRTWPADDYHWLRRNCLAFANELCRRLGVGAIPPWIDRFARGASYVEPGWAVVAHGVNVIQEGIKDANEFVAPLMTNGLAAAANIYHGRDGVTERNAFRWEVLRGSPNAETAENTVCTFDEENPWRSPQLWCLNDEFPGWYRHEAQMTPDAVTAENTVSTFDEENPWRSPRLRCLDDEFSGEDAGVASERGCMLRFSSRPMRRMCLGWSGASFTDRAPPVSRSDVECTAASERLLLCGGYVRAGPGGARKMCVCSGYVRRPRDGAPGIAVAQQDIPFRHHADDAAGVASPWTERTEVDVAVPEEPPPRLPRLYESVCRAVVEGLDNLDGQHVLRCGQVSQSKDQSADYIRRIVFL